jgi:hypothetical protein
MVLVATRPVLEIATVATPEASVVRATEAAVNAALVVYLVPFTVTDFSSTPVEAGTRVAVVAKVATTATAGAATGVVAVFRAVTFATNEPLVRTTPAEVASLPATIAPVSDEIERTAAVAEAAEPRTVEL